MADPEPVQSQSPPAGAPGQPDTKNATLSLVMGILSLFIPFAGLILGILAIVFYNKQKRIAPNGMATAGLVCGIIGIIGNIVLIAFFGLMMIALVGVMQPERFTPDRCVASPPFSCLEYRAANGQVDLRLQNNAGYDLQNVQVELVGCGIQIAPTLANGDSASLSFPCELPPDGTQFQSTYAVTYHAAGDSVPGASQKTSTGTLTVRVEPSYVYPQ